MGFAHGHVEVFCDWCKLETEPVDCGGNFDVAAREIKRDGWLAEKIRGEWEVVCPMCLEEANAPTTKDDAS